MRTSVNAQGLGANVADIDSQPQSPTLLVDMRGIDKRFPGVRALDQVDFQLHSGEVHVLFGENGAGKSTLINIMAGTYPADAGIYRFCGKSLSNLVPHQARRIGISPVFQEFSLAPDLTIEENLFLGRELSRGGILNKREMRGRVADVLDDLGFELSPRSRVADLSRAQQQMTEIAKALLHDLRVLILDEPTASLSERETERLFEIIERLKGEGVGIVYISHRLAEIKRVGDRVTVLRDGHRVGTVDASAVSEDKLVEMMTGRTFEALFPAIRHRPGRTLLETHRLTTENRRVINADFAVRAGEVVGIAGLVGCGKSELARAAFGLEVVSSGTLTFEGSSVANPTPSHMLKRGLCFFPSDRVAEGLSLARPIRENMSLAALDLEAFATVGILRLANEQIRTREMIAKLQVLPPDGERRVEFLSGGNRQKVMLARGLARNIKVFLLDEPTVGIDVGAKVEVYHLIQEMAESGAGVVVISSELPEILHLSNRVYVMHRGYVVAELANEEIDEATVLSHFFDRDRTRDGSEGTSAGTRATQ